MKTRIFSYRFAEEILEHPRYNTAWDEIKSILEGSPLFIYPNKSEKNAKLDVVQQVMNTYYDRRFAIDFKWDYHPLATDIKGSSLKADFRKIFGKLGIQIEVQFGNMSRWYTDIFKFQTAYSQKLIQVAISVVPTVDLAKRIDSNVVNFERAQRELPSAVLSITLPILLVGLYADEKTPTIDISECNFPKGSITGKGGTDNRFRIVHGYLNDVRMKEINKDSPTGRILENSEDDAED